MSGRTLRWLTLVLSIAVVLQATACRDQASEDRADSGDASDAVDTDIRDSVDDTDGRTASDDCFTPYDGNNLDDEGAGEEELPDCITGCDRAWSDLGDVIDLTSQSSDGVRGVLDAQSIHRWDSLGSEPGPDVDIIALQAPARTMVEVTVEPVAENSAFDPVVRLHDGVTAGGLTFNDDASTHTRAARSAVAYPFASDAGALFVVVEAKQNYVNFPQPDAEFVGGEGYEYRLVIRTSPFEATDLGTLTNEDPVESANAEALSCPGAINYYKFAADAGFTVQFDRIGPDAFTGQLAGMRSVDGRMQWLDYEADTPNSAGGADGQVVIDETYFEPCADCPAEGPFDYYFAVTDFDGKPFAKDNYTYDLTVSLSGP